MGKLDAVLYAVMLTFLTSILPVSSADHWLPSDSPGMSTNNNCGAVSAVVGSPRIRRAFMNERDRGFVAGVADRLRSGDEIEVPANGRLEWLTGKNIIAILGPGARIRVEGLRSFVDADGVRITRLDLRLLWGEFRLQARLNQEHPEAVLVGLGGADVLIERGDVMLVGGNAWSGSVVSEGGVQARVKLGGAMGAPFSVLERMSISSTGEGKLDDAAITGIQTRLPFSFELAGAALPPIPPLGPATEALGP